MAKRLGWRRWSLCISLPNFVLHVNPNHHISPSLWKFKSYCALQENLQHIGLRVCAFLWDRLTWTVHFRRPFHHIYIYFSENVVNNIKEYNNFVTNALPEQKPYQWPWKSNSISHTMKIMLYDSILVASIYGYQEQCFFILQQLDFLSLSCKYFASVMCDCKSMNSQKKFSIVSA